MQQTWEAICSPQMVCRILSEPLAHSALVQAVDIQQRMDRKGLARDQVSDRRVRRGLENPASRGPERGIYLEKFQAEETPPPNFWPHCRPCKQALDTLAPDDSVRPHASFCIVCIKMAFSGRSNPSAQQDQHRIDAPVLVRLPFDQDSRARDASLAQPEIWSHRWEWMGQPELQS